MDEMNLENTLATEAAALDTAAGAAALDAELKESAMPALVFGAEEEPEAPVAQMVDEQKKVEPIDDSMLSEAERKQVDAFSKQINLGDTNSILQYGGGVQKKMSEFSDTALATVRTRDLGEVGEMLSGVIGNLKEFDPNEEDEKGFLGFFKKQKRKVEDLKVEYDKANTNVEKVAKALQAHQVTLMKDVATLDKMYEKNLTYYKELTMYIIAGKKRIQSFKDNELAVARAKAERSSLPEDAQYVKDLEDQLNRFEKKIHDLELTRMIAIQTAPQIRLIQSSDTMMVEKIQSTLVNTIPLWKNQMVLALGIEDSTKAAKAEAAVTEMANKLLNANAEKLKTATIETAKASERGIVDLETLKKTNESLIQTLDEVSRIQTEGREKRAQAEAELAVLERELKDKLLAVGKKG